MEVAALGRICPVEEVEPSDILPPFIAPPLGLVGADVQAAPPLFEGPFVGVDDPLSDGEDVVAGAIVPAGALVPAGAAVAVAHVCPHVVAVVAHPC